MRKFGLLLILVIVSVVSTGETAQAGRWFKFLEIKSEHLYSPGPRLPFTSFDRGYYQNRYPFNQYYTPQAHSYQAFPDYHR